MTTPLALSFLAAAMAAGPSPIGNEGPAPLEQYISDLNADRRSDRLFAARELRRRVRYADRSAASKAGTLRQLEGRQELAFFAKTIGPRCQENLLSFPELRVPCAEILAILDAQESLPTLHEALQIDPRRWARKRIQRAITLLHSPDESKP